MKLKPQRQGEAILKPITELPTEAIKQEVTKRLIVAHSETGHHHVLEQKKGIQVYVHNGERYIEVPEISRLFHEKGDVHQHREQVVQPGIYKINIKKEFDYFEGVIREVRD